MAATEQKLSPRTQAALQYLRRLKPLDGYAVERYLASSGKLQVRLKRRWVHLTCMLHVANIKYSWFWHHAVSCNWYLLVAPIQTHLWRNIPVRDEGFEEIVVDRSAGHVVGIQVVTSRGDAGRGVILVDKNGKLCDDDSTITVQMANVSSITSAGSQQHGSASRSSSSSGSRQRRSSARAETPSLSDENNQLLLQYGLMALGALIVLKIIFTALNVLSIILLPAIYFYASATARPTKRLMQKKNWRGWCGESTCRRNTNRRDFSSKDWIDWLLAWRRNWLLVLDMK